MSGTGLWTTDHKYEMLPDNTIVTCQFIDHSGNFIKKAVDIYQPPPSGQGPGDKFKGKGFKSLTDKGDYYNRM